MGLPTNRVSTHPGVFLQEDFLDPLGITQTELAEHIGVPVQRINEIIRGKRGVTPETAWLLSQALGMSAEFWMSMQAMHDLTRTRPKRKIRPMKQIIEYRKSPEYLAAGEAIAEAERRSA